MNVPMVCGSQNHLVTTLLLFFVGIVLHYTYVHAHRTTHVCMYIALHTRKKYITALVVKLYAHQVIDCVY